MPNDTQMTPSQERFGAGPDGANPRAGLVQATNGNLYGTTYGGGANSVGTIFSLSVKNPYKEPE